MTLTSDPRYICAKASVYYWQKLGRTDPAAIAKLAHWQGVLDELRTKHNGTAALHRKRAPGPKKLVEMPVWKPTPLCWD